MLLPYFQTQKLPLSSSIALKILSLLVRCIHSQEGAAAYLCDDFGKSNSEHVNLSYLQRSKMLASNALDQQFSDILELFSSKVYIVRVWKRREGEKFLPCHDFPVLHKNRTKSAFVWISPP